MSTLLEWISLNKTLSYWITLVFFIVFGFVVTQPYLFTVERTQASLPSTTKASYESLLNSSNKRSGDIYLELFHLWQEEENPVITYVIKRWDSLSTIAKQFGTTISAISDENNLRVWWTLRVGQSLSIVFEEGTVIPVPETMTIKTFTDRYNLDYEEFLSINYFEEWADLLEKDEEVFVQLNESEALRVWLLRKEDFVRLDFILPEPAPIEVISDPVVDQPQEDMVELVNDIVNEEIVENNNDITQRDLEILENTQDSEPDIYEQEIVNSQWEWYDPITSQAYEQVIIDAQETQQYLEDLKQKKKEELEAKQKAEEEKKKAEDAEREAQEARDQQLAQEETQRREQAAAQAKRDAERAVQQAEQARLQAIEAERQAAISAQQAVGIQQEYIAATITCPQNQCLKDNTCYDKPEFAECAPQNPNEAWICRWWYIESWWTCIKYLPAPASNGKVLKQWYFNPHKADSRVRWRGAGQCTAWVAYLWAQNYGIDMRRDLWMKWNAAQRWRNAKNVWLTTSQTPIPGSIWRTSRSHGYYGHVVYVDEVYADEWLMLITDMNYRWAYQFTQRIEKISRMDWFIYPPS